MASGGFGMDYWREYFRSSNGDLFETIEKAIILAASDYPKEFRIRRDAIAQTLFSSSSNNFINNNNNNNKVVVSSNYIAEALSDEIEEESQIYGEVMRIKEVVQNHRDESESVLYHSLRKLQLMPLSVETLKATEIGKSINVLRKHVSEDVSNMAKTLIQAWKDIVDEWVTATEKAAALSEATPESLNPSVLDEEVEEEEEGLPSPPLDDLAFFYPQMELSQFFDGMDEYGNPGNNNGRTEEQKKCKPTRSVPVMVERDVTKTKKKEASFVKASSSAPGRSLEVKKERKLQTEPKRPSSSSHQSNPRAKGEAMAQDKFEATKRKLQERYQQAESVKKQRTIQVMELHDLPKPKQQQQQQVRNRSNHNRHR